MKKSRKMRTEGEREMEFDSVQSIIDWHKLPHLQKLELVRSNISKLQLMQFKKVAELEYVAIAKLLSITDRTLYIMQDHHLFNITRSDILASFIDIYGYGYIMFSNPTLFNKWMHLGCAEMEYRSPLDYCDTQGGREMVKMEISRISSQHNGTLQLSQILVVGLIK